MNPKLDDPYPYELIVPLDKPGFEDLDEADQHHLRLQKDDLCRVGRLPIHMEINIDYYNQYKFKTPLSSLTKYCLKYMRARYE